MTDCPRHAFNGCHGDGGDTCRNCPATPIIVLPAPEPAFTPGECLALVIIAWGMAFALVSEILYMLGE